MSSPPVPCSGSMEPAFFRGDLLFLTHDRADPIKAGDIVVFRIEGRDIPIVHRALKVHIQYVTLRPLFLCSVPYRPFEFSCIFQYIFSLSI